jgi:DNA repair protein RadC
VASELPSGPARPRDALALLRERPDLVGERELLGRLLGGGPGPARAERLLEGRELAELARATRDGLIALGLGPRAAERLVAAFELGRRVERSRPPPRRCMRSPERVAALMAPELRGLDRETFHALLLDGKHRLRRRLTVSQGTLTASLVHPREVFGPALREGAAALIVVHNHPSGDPEPSLEDLSVTRRLLEAGRLVGVPLLDHVVVADGGWVSLRERMAF